MPLRHVVTLIGAAALGLCSVAGAAESRPSNYDQCITDSMRGVGSDVAARAIIASCRNQFPDTAPLEAAAAQGVSVAPQPAAAAPAAPPAVVAPSAAVPAAVAAPSAAPQVVAESRELTAEELGNLSVSAFIFSDSYRMTIRNGNENLTVGQVTLEIWNESRPDDKRRYTQAVNIAPLSSDSASFKDVDPGARFESSWTAGSDAQWAIVAARTR